jgi:hypothetical protein
MLMSIVSPGFSEDYDRSATTGTPRWQGASGAYVQERLRSYFNQNGGSNRVQQVTVFIDADLPLSTPLQEGDTITYNYRGKNFTCTVQDMAAPELPGVASYVKVALEKAVAS